MNHSDDTDKILLTPQDVSARIGVKVGTLAVWRCTGRVALPYIKVGRRPMYDPADVAVFIETRRRNYPGFGREVN